MKSDSITLKNKSGYLMKMAIMAVVKKLLILQMVRLVKIQVMPLQVDSYIMLENKGNDGYNRHLIKLVKLKMNYHQQLPHPMLWLD